ncbi:InlB B-repeat-containing protein [Clostridiaceae bacterium Marseille-Q4149]|nr:InlB B-repeat-containing protein [Clostridiaceae bacterium Marseille-Q4149]
MRKRILSLMLCCVMLLGLMPTTAFAADTGKGIQLGASGISGYDSTTGYASDFVDIDLTVGYHEQFSLTPGGRYYFDLSAMGIPGTANGSLPDTTLHYVPFTYAGTIEAYKLTSAMATTEEYAQREKYPHSLFIADYAVTNDVSWDALNTADLIFSKNYASGGVGYTLRAPSVGSRYTGSGDSIRGTPLSNEWDKILDKDSGYIKNWSEMSSWGQDTKPDNSFPICAFRGYRSARFWNLSNAAYSSPSLGFRPVLEVLNSDTLGSDGLKVVTLDLNGGKLGGSSDAIQIIVKNGSTFTAPASDGLNRPDENTGSYFMWLGSDGKLYAPGANVPAEVTKLTAQFALSEQFSLKPGGTYYFDLSAMGIPGTVNTGNEDGAVSLPDTSLHYVPFTYAGTIEAYKLTSATATTEEYAQQNKYPHSLFVADYAVTHTISWGGLNDEGLIFGKNYASGGVDYTLRAPSVGSISTGSGDSQRGVPQSNEWDTMLNKNSGYIQNWNKMYSWGQDTSSAAESFRAYRGYNSARFWYYTSSSFRNVYLGFRPVLEVLNPGTLGSDGLKVVTLDLGGGKLGNSSEDIQIIVKTGSEFTAPASDGLTRPDGDTGSYFMWLGSNGKLYAPGGSVPADVTELTVQWTAPTYAVTLHTNGGTINSGNVTGYTYGVGATLPTADDMTYTGYTFKGWYDNEGLTGSPVTAIGDTETGNKEYWAKWEANAYTVTLNTNGGTINNGNVTEYTYGVGATLPTDVTRTGYTFKGWYDNENLTGSPVTAISNTETGNKEYWAKWEINQYTITVKPENGKADITITQDYGTPITAPTLTREGYQFNGWDKAFPTTMPAENLTITAQWRDIAVPTGEIKIAENGWKSFFNTITFGLFFKDTQMVTVTAADNSGEAVKIEYLLSDKALTESELAGMTFTAYSAPFSINPDNEYVIYAKLTDTSGNVAYINTNGIVLDATVPVISGIENGKTYCAAQTITVDEKYIGTVKVNGTEVILDENGQFILSPASGEQTIVVTDKAGNETRVTVTVNDGHTYEWQSENGQYWQKCKFCNHETAKKDIPTINISGSDKVCRTQDYKFSFTLPEGATDAAYGYEFIGLGDGPLTPTVENGLYSGIIKASTYPAKENSFKLIVSAKTADGFEFSAEKTVAIQNAHSGGTATCKDKAICEVCGESYGELDPNNHANLKHIDAKAATKTSEGNIEYWYCDGCKKYYKDAKATQEIKQVDTVTAKRPDDSKSPQTGDNSNLALWIALLFVSDGAVTATTVYGRKKKRLTK